MALETYRQKRNFGVTPEPAGKVGAVRRRGLSFVVQKHAARQLHYDFRLELDGVLLSWAVPKGPSLDPNDKRLAMHVEDHPLEYGDFEGVIPPKQYGAGTVMVWDRGTWMPRGDPREGYTKGHLKFELRGEKLKGIWNLVRSRSGKYGGEKSWLLFKEADDFARLGADARVIDDQPDSVASGRSIEQIAAQKDRVWHSNRSLVENVKRGAVAKRQKRPASVALAKLKGAKKAALPKAMEAQLATLVKSPPAGDGWVHEVKYDGYRMLCRIAKGDVRMISRNGKDWTASFPALVDALGDLKVESAWLDGEAAVVNQQGRTSFQALQNALSGSGADLSYLAFDLLYLDGYDLRGVALIERKRVLAQLLEDAPPALKYSEHFAVPGAAFRENVCKLGLEGMVSKRGDQPYRAGRGPAWQKTKCARRQEMVIGGYTDPEGSRERFGALLLGVHESDGSLSYAGKVGTGFTAASLASVYKALKPLERKDPPFRNPPRGAEARRAHWVKPTLVAEVEFTEWTAEGTLRHPSFQGLRTDKKATDVVREREADSGGDPAVDPPEATMPRRSSPASHAKGAIAGVVLTNPDKVLYPEARLSKRELALYYEAVGERMLPHLRGRPLTLVRCPNGWDKKCFYQKNADAGVPDTIDRVAVGEGAVYTMANTVTAIVALLQLGVLEIHPWGSRVPKLGHPDRIIFDLDPDEALPWDDVKQAVLLLRTLAEQIGLVPFLKTTGGKGLHVVVPIEPKVGWDDVKGFAKAVAELLERTFPDRFTSKLLKVSRHRRIFIDYLRNAEGSTAVAPYSLRAKANAPVATPIRWDELARDVRFDHFNARNVPARISRMKTDPWRDLERSAVALTPAIMAKVGYEPAR
jgi:bifunctional non-homologous end joining protein LigD